MDLQQKIVIVGMAGLCLFSDNLIIEATIIALMLISLSFLILKDYFNNPQQLQGASENLQNQDIPENPRMKEKEIPIPNSKAEAQENPSLLSIQCKSCKAFSDASNMISECKHICDACLINLLRKKSTLCPFCKDIITFTSPALIKKHKKTCEFCKNSLNDLVFFKFKLCKHNLCLDCLSLCHNGLCLIDSEPLNLNLLSSHVPLTEINQLACNICKSKYKASSILQTIKSCACEICEECQIRKNLNECTTCGNEFDEKVKNWLKERSTIMPRCGIKDCEKLVVPQNAFQVRPCGHFLCWTCVDNWTTVLMESSLNLKKKIERCPACLQLVDECIPRLLLCPEYQERVKRHSG